MKTISKFSLTSNNPINKVIQLIILMIVCISYNTIAQDVIHKTDGSAIEAKVREVLEDKIKYNRTDNPDGPLYTIDKTKIFKITVCFGF